MCGRYARFSSVKAFAERFHAQSTLTLTESYNVAPTQAVLLARNAEDGERELAALHWGLIPAWSKEPKTPYSTINARQGLASAMRSPCSVGIRMTRIAMALPSRQH